MSANRSARFGGFLIAFLFVVLGLAQDAGAVPAFARQTGMACNACHFQHFPALNGSAGRSNRRVHVAGAQHG
jgi:hypothetical protein